MQIPRMDMDAMIWAIHGEQLVQFAHSCSLSPPST